MLTNVPDSMMYLLKIIMSHPFKILQYKSQALPLNGRKMVHNRLTHSLEVAQISRQLAVQVYGHEANDQIGAIEIAGLVHDIGIPPFGHTGETSIREWCEVNCQQLMPKTLASSIMKSNYWDDFIHFDGNAQGMRILLRYPFDGQQFDTSQLSKKMISAYFKYNQLPSPHYKKSGYFYADKCLLESALSDWNMNINIRPVTSCLVEMADDIAHSIGDIKDCIQNKLVTFSHFISWLLPLMDSQVRAYILNKIPDATLERSCDQFFNVLLNKVILEASKNDSFERMRGDTELMNHDQVEFYDNNYLKLLKWIKKYVSAYAYTNDDKVHVDWAGYKGIHAVLDACGRLLRLSRENFLSLLDYVNFGRIYGNGLEMDFKLASLLSKEWIVIYLQESSNATDLEEWHLRMHLILDTLCAMTNQEVLDF